MGAKRIGRWALGAAVMTAGMTMGVAQAAPPPPKPPYYASFAAERTRMRSGPGRTFPATWLYVRRDLPVRVVDTFKEWRKVEDPAGTQGWILATLVSSARAAMVTEGAPAELRDRPGGGSVRWRAAPDVVGRISECANGWCRFDVQGRAGYVEVRRLWGVDATEVLP